MTNNIRTENDIISAWKGGVSNPFVSICCATYNHEKFVEEALKGFLIQQTDFPFEILIHDDASTDGTTEIIREWQKQYPLIIKPVFQTENQFSTGKKIRQILVSYTKGKYIAVCDGDDYWTDPNKLQIQFNFLESNPDYVVSGHDIYYIDAAGQKFKDTRLQSKYKRDFSGDDVIKGKAWLPNMSCLYRNVITKFPAERSMVKNGDIFTLSLLGHFGRSKYHDGIKPAAYRVHSGGIWSMVPKRDRLDAQINTHFWMYRYYRRIGDNVYARYYWRKYLSYVFRATHPMDIIKAFFIRIFRWGWKRNE
ncbi:MAG: glycosyltransferase [Methylophagaceae bacterium]